mgnify:CR=1 FL=1
MYVQQVTFLNDTFDAVPPEATEKEESYDYAYQQQNLRSTTQWIDIHPVTQKGDAMTQHATVKEGKPSDASDRKRHKKYDKTIPQTARGRGSRCRNAARNRQRRQSLEQQGAEAIRRCDAER